MKKTKLAAILSFLGSLVFFGLTLFLFHSYQRFLGNFAYYGISEKDLVGTSATDVITDFKFGIAKYAFLGAAAFITAILLFRKR